MSRCRRVAETMNKMGFFVLLAAITLSGCRATWQYPDRVIASLNIRSGDHVADIGAGDGKAGIKAQSVAVRRFGGPDRLPLAGDESATWSPARPDLQTCGRVSPVRCGGPLGRCEWEAGLLVSFITIRQYDVCRLTSAV